MIRKNTQEDAEIIKAEAYKNRIRPAEILFKVGINILKE